MGEPDKAISLPNLRVLWVFVRPHRRTLIFGMLLGLVGTGASLATPMVTKSVLDGLGSGQSFGGAVALLVVLLVIGSAVLYVQWIMLGTLAERIVLDARKSMVSSYFRATVGSLATRPTGELVTVRRPVQRRCPQRARLRRTGDTHNPRDCPRESSVHTSRCIGSRHLAGIGLGASRSKRAGVTGRA